jgi:hypothetical protein
MRETQQLVGKFEVTIYDLLKTAWNSKCTKAVNVGHFRIMKGAVNILP